MIFLKNSSNNNIVANIITNCIGSGVYLLYSNNNNIIGNTSNNNTNSGISIHYSNNNIVDGNICIGNGEGLYPYFGKSYSIFVSGNYNNIQFNTCRLITVLTGNFISATNNYAILGNNASIVSNIYNDLRINIIDGTGAGQQNRIITYYTGSTKRIDISPSWVTTPDAASVYEIIGYSLYGISINTTGVGNLVTNNDLYYSGVFGSLNDLGTGTITTAGNRM